MIKSVLILMIVNVLSVSSVFAECAHERKVLGSELKNLKSNSVKTIHVQIESGAFKKLTEIQNIDLNKGYLINESHSSELMTKQIGSYDQVNIKYYGYDRINTYLSENQALFQEFGYQVTVVGQSILGRNLYALFPLETSNTKKTIVMTGRQHGDEGSANYIIEGFLNELFSNANKSWHSDHQLVLYPMVNPDGAEKHVRYNNNGRDLNRSWHRNASGEHDEIVHIHNHLRTLWSTIEKNIFIVLDMHGSFTEDFIYRVNKSYRGDTFFAHQQEFISELKNFDPWQNGNFQLSSGSRTMARIVMVKDFGMNALTHETPRDIKLNNSLGRSIQTLMDQGVGVFTSIRNLY
ncbi:MAG: hypothetical protein ACI9QD_001207 [Thermoproteota archaeon]|jgi:hypothetical protein